jgi:hypothetical protein
LRGLCAEESLKGARRAAEESRVFFPRTVSLELDGPRVCGLWISLNTPVVSTEELAVGPARAGLLVHLEPDGRPNVTIGIRSLRSGDVVLYSFQGDLREHSSLAVGIDAGLSFAESMGFLFDEDELGDGSPDAMTRCLGLWNEVMGSAAEDPGARDGISIGGDPASSGLEVLGVEHLTQTPGAAEDYVPQFEGDLGGHDPLDFEGGLDPDGLGVDLGISARSFEVAEGAPEPVQPGIALDLGVEAIELGAIESLAAEASATQENVAAVLEAQPREPAGLPPVGLSKFRGAAHSGIAPPPPPREEASSQETSKDETSSRTALARVRLVRRGGEAARRPHPIIRLLGAF